MADDTTDTRPGPVPGGPTTGDDGSLPDLSGRRGWVWMQDTDDGGGGRFDVRADRVDVWRRKGATVVPGYPVHFGPSGRPGKPRHRYAEPDTGKEYLEPGTPGEQTPTPDADATTPDPADDTDQAADEPAVAATTPEPTEAEPTDPPAGEPAADDTKTTMRKGGRTR